MGDSEFIYIDESSFNINGRNSWGWAKKGTTPTASFPRKSQNYSLIAAMTYEGIIGYQIVKGGVKGEDFYGFINELLIHEKNRFATKNVVLFMDNASIHKTKNFMQKFSLYYTVVYNAPYTPQFNPIEFAFSKIKFLAQKKKSKNEKELMNNIFEAIKSTTSMDCIGYIYNSIKYLQKGYENINFF
jgi:transposase